MYREGVDKSKESNLTSSHFDLTMIAISTCYFDFDGK